MVYAGHMLLYLCCIFVQDQTWDLQDLIRKETDRIVFQGLYGGLHTVTYLALDCIAAVMFVSDFCKYLTN